MAGLSLRNLPSIPTLSERASALSRLPLPTASSCGATLKASKPAAARIVRTRSWFAKANGPGASGSTFGGTGGKYAAAACIGKVEVGFSSNERPQAKASRPPGLSRSEERRVGHGCGRTCKSRVSPYQKQKKRRKKT